MYDFLNSFYICQILLKTFISTLIVRFGYEEKGGGRGLILLTFRHRYKAIANRQAAFAS